MVIYRALTVLKWLPKITIFYVAFSLMNGVALNNIFIGVTLLFDLLDWIPVD